MYHSETDLTNLLNEVWALLEQFEHSEQPPHPLLSLMLKRRIDALAKAAASFKK